MIPQINGWCSWAYATHQGTRETAGGAQLEALPNTANKEIERSKWATSIYSS